MDWKRWVFWCQFVSIVLLNIHTSPRNTLYVRIAVFTNLISKLWIEGGIESSTWLPAGAPNTKIKKLRTDKIKVRKGFFLLLISFYFFFRCFCLIALMENIIPIVLLLLCQCRNTSTIAMRHIHALGSNLLRIFDTFHHMYNCNYMTHYTFQYFKINNEGMI